MSKGRPDSLLAKTMLDESWLRPCIIAATVVNASDGAECSSNAPCLLEIHTAVGNKMCFSDDVGKLKPDQDNTRQIMATFRGGHATYML